MSYPQTYCGFGRYLTDHRVGADVLPVAVACMVGHRPDRDMALLDTAAHWCVLTPELAEELGYLVAAGSVRLSSRFGDFRGELVRIPLTLLEDTGDPLIIEATWFVCEDWPGPLVIGWKGGLERLRFALDPREDAFYFGELHGPGS